MQIRNCVRIMVGLPLLAACSTGIDVPATARGPVRSFLEARQQNVVVQQWDISCGAAALATLLTYQHGDAVTEREVASGMLRRTNIDLVRRRLGFSLLDLKRYAESRGLTADGYSEMTIEDLLEVGPTIVPVVLRSLPHFVIFRGIQGDRVLLADPAFGNRTMRIDAFERVWTSRMGFTVNRTDGQTPPNQLAAHTADFWASSLAFAPLRDGIVMASRAGGQTEAGAEAAASPALGVAPTARAEAAPASLVDAGRPTLPAERPVAAAQDSEALRLAVATSGPARRPASRSSRATVVPEGALQEAVAPQLPHVMAKPDGAAAAPAGRWLAAISSSRLTNPQEVLRHRGDAMLALGDISAARLFYERAALAGSAAAARALAETYDPAMLARIGVRGMQPDQNSALAWYRRAASLGDEDAAARVRDLSSMPAGTEPATHPEHAPDGSPTVSPPRLPSDTPDRKRVTEAGPSTAADWAQEALEDGDRLLGDLAMRIELLEGDLTVAALAQRLKVLEADRMVAGFTRRIGALEERLASRLSASFPAATRGNSGLGSDGPIILAEAWVEGLQPDVAAALVKQIAGVPASGAN